MGAFCVFGVSRQQCRVKAEKKVPTMVGSGRDRRALPIAEWAQEVKVATDSLFITETRAVKISPEFDAPQFCRDWIAVVPRDVRLTQIMVRGPKVDKHGALVVKDGAPVMTWVPFDEKQNVPRPFGEVVGVDTPQRLTPKPVDRPVIKAGSRTEVRYRNPDDPLQTWTGRGKQPRWVADWAQGGKSLDALRVPGAAA
jgi:hypothetical protein